MRDIVAAVVMKAMIRKKSEMSAKVFFGSGNWNFTIVCKSDAASQIT